MKYFYPHILTLTLITSIISSCETVVDVDIPLEEPHIVVNSLVNPDSAWQVKLSKSRHILDDSPFPAITDAIVNIYSGENQVTSLQHTQQGNYISTEKLPQSGKTYQLKIEMPEGRSASATATIPELVEITDVKLDSAIWGDGDFEIGNGENDNQQPRITTHFRDPGNQKHFYKLEAFLKYAPPEQSTQVPDDLPFDEAPPQEPSVKDTIINPINLNSNDPAIENTGNFNENGIYFSDEIFNGKKYGFQVFINYLPARISKFEIIVYLKSISEAYFLYLQSTNLQQSTEGNPFAEPVPVYNNITNGLGIFGAYQTDQYILKVNN